MTEGTGWEKEHNNQDKSLDLHANNSVNNNGKENVETLVYSDLSITLFNLSLANLVAETLLNGGSIQPRVLNG